MKGIVYLRTSTKEQNPELQRQDCLNFCKERNIKIVEVVAEQGSAFNLEKNRPLWDKVQERAKKEGLNIIIWRYDRAFRNRVEFFKFMKVMFEVYNKKVYSVKEGSILSFWEMMNKSHSENPVFNELLNGIFKALWDFLIQNAGEEAEEESKKKSERIKLAVKTNSGVTRSYKGNKWGRKAIKQDEEIIKLHNEGKTIRQIAELVSYWDKNKNKRNVSVGYVHKTISKFKELKA